MDGIVFYSHRDPFIKLKNHLRDVAERCLKIYRKQKEFIKLPIDEELIENIAIAHDFGKYTSFFQEYIKNKRKDMRNRHHHGFISALFGAWLVEDKEYLPLIAYFVIKHHHGDLKNFDEDLDDSLIISPILLEQIEDLKQSKEQIECELGFEIGDFFINYQSIWKKLKKLKFKLFEFEKQEKRIETYFTILYTYSLLIDSDKKSAGKVEISERKNLPEDLLEKYRKLKNWENPKKEINRLRNQLYYEVKEKVQSLERIPAISTITAPTGLGKTYLNLEVALQYRKKLWYKPKIIYSLPFVSIIDQTYKIYDEILTKVIGKEYLKNKSLYLLKHHHLSDTKYKKENEEKPISESLLLIESWNSEIIITTFVQFLHSVIAFKNSFIKKFHNIVGSIIILDEIQSIDVSLWKVIKKVLNKLTELFNCKIVLSTATQPLMFEEYTELVENQSKYFRHSYIKRTILVPKMGKEKTIEEFANYLLENLEKNINSYLVVLNTIKSSIEFFEIINKNIGNEYKVFYLSTNIIPAQRKVRIEKLKKLLNSNEKIILVSTQVIEAGVDLDFQKVYRDVAPLDSIIQVAGRCNRNKKYDIGIVEIHRLYNPEINKEFSKIIYGSTAVEISTEILKENIEETNYKELSESYFKYIEQNKSFEKSEKVLKAIENLKFYKDENSIAKEFKIIEELPVYTDLFIEINQTARRIYKKFEKEVLKEKDFLRRFENYHRIKKNFKKYIVSVPHNFLRYAINTESFPKIPLENIEDYYDKETIGLKRTREKDAIIF